MMNYLKLFFSLFILVFSISVQAEQVIYQAEIRDTINPATHDHLKTTLIEAEKANAVAVLIELDTPGGLVSSVRSMAQVIDQSKVPVIVYVSPAGAAATSAGALLMLASHYAVMAPGTNIGAAHPVSSGGKNVEGDMREKVENDTAAFARGLAELRGRNIKIAEDVVRKSTSFTSEEALKNGFIEQIASSKEEILSALEGKTLKGNHKEWKLSQLSNVRFHLKEMTFAQKLLTLLANPNIAAILMSLGMLLIYVELNNPGITIAGVLGGLCLLLAFMTFQVIPIQTGGLIMLVLGVILMVLEPFVVAHGILAVGGLVFFLLGLLWVVDPSESDLKIDHVVFISVALAMSSLVGLISWAAIRMRILSKKIRDEIGGGSALGGLKGYPARIQSVGPQGLTGKALIRGEIWSFIADKPVQKEDTVVVKDFKGFKVQVTKQNKEGN